MNYYYSIFCSIFLSCFSFAQQITVVNERTKKPIVGVAIYNSTTTKSAVTNFNGTANLDAFLDQEIIYFQHISYITKGIVKNEINFNQPFVLQSQEQNLEEVVLSASKFEQYKREIPQKIINITAKNIQFNMPQTSADVLEETGQVFVQKSQLGGGSPMIRGFSTNRLLITIDDVRMNNAIFRSGNLQNVISIDPFSIANTEVTLGANSVLYGSDAIGGVMSFYTKKPKLSYTDTLKVKGETTIRYASASNEKTGNVALHFGTKKWGLFTNVTFSDFEDLKMGKNGPNDYLRPEYVQTTTNGQDQIVLNKNPRIQKFTAYKQYNFLQKIRFVPNAETDLNLGLYYTTTSNFPRYDRLLEYKDNHLKAAEWNYGPQQWLMANFGLHKLSSTLNMYDKFRLTAAYQNFKESRIDRKFQNTNRRKRSETVNAYNLNLDFEKEISAKEQLFYGMEYVFNTIFSKATTKNIATNTVENSVTRYPNGATWQSAAMYASFKYKPVSQFILQSGLRYNFVSYTASFNQNNAYLNLPFSTAKNNLGALTGTLGFSWLPSKIIEWKLNFGTAFRAPNIDDVGKVFDSEPGAVVVPNQNLKAEYAYEAELGLQLNFDSKCILDLATYYTYLDNALVRRAYNLNGATEIMYDGELSNVQAIQNASKSWIYGFEAGIQFKINQQLYLKSQINIIGGTEDNEGKEVPVRHVAPNFGNTHLIWKRKKFTIDLFAVYNSDLAYNQLALSEREKTYMYALDANGKPYAPSWYTLNFRSQLTVVKNLDLTLNLENITNQRYKTYSSGIAAPGFNTIVAMHYSF